MSTSSVVEPFYSDDQVTLWCADARVLLAEGALSADAIVCDPPYGSTPLPWDRWPDGWPGLARSAARSMFCFGTMRMFLDRRDEFDGWRFAQDLIWEKNAGSGPGTRHFYKVHETVTHWYQGSWDDVHTEVQREANPNGVRPASATVAQGRGHPGSATRNAIGDRRPDYVFDGTRRVRSVIRAPKVHRWGWHKTQKPPQLLAPIIRYAVPPGGTVVDLFAGSGQTLLTARDLGRRAVGVEADPRACELIVEHLAAGVSGRPARPVRSLPRRVARPAVASRFGAEVELPYAGTG